MIPIHKSFRVLSVGLGLWVVGCSAGDPTSLGQGSTLASVDDVEAPQALSMFEALEETSNDSSNAVVQVSKRYKIRLSNALDAVFATASGSSAPRAPTFLRVDVPGQPTLVFSRVHAQESRYGHWVWSGHAKDSQSATSVSLVFSYLPNSQRAVGRLQGLWQGENGLEEKTYFLTPGDAGSLWLEQSNINEDFFAERSLISDVADPYGEPAELSTLAPAAPTSGSLHLDSWPFLTGPAIDLAIYYTQRTVDGYFKGDEDVTRAAMGWIVESLNEATNASASSNVEGSEHYAMPRFRLVHVEKAEGIYEGKQIPFDTVWNEFLSSPYASAFPNGADMAHLVAETNTQFCGKAYITAHACSEDGSCEFFPNLALGITDAQCVWAYTLEHETGHMLGNHHNAEHAELYRAYSYSLGFRECTDSPRQRTIMSYFLGCPGSQRVPVFSNPNVFYNGASVGVAGETENARSMRNTATGVSGYRESVIECVDNADCPHPDTWCIVNTQTCSCTVEQCADLGQLCNVATGQCVACIDDGDCDGEPCSLGGFCGGTDLFLPLISLSQP